MAEKQKMSLKQKLSGLWSKTKSMWKVPPKGRYLTLKEMGCFGIYALGVAFMTSAVNYVATVAFIPYFYRIDSIHGYIIMALSSFVNMCILPFIANKMEKTKTKWGRYKPYILFTLPLYIILAILATWIPEMDVENNRIIYAYLTIVPLLIANGFFYNMYQMMPTLITPETQERADLMTPIGLIFGFAPSILQIVAGPIRAHYLAINQEFMAIRIIGIISVCIGVICVLFILKVKERTYSIASEENKEEKVKFVDAMKMLSHNKPLIILTIALVLGSLREFTAQFRQFIIQFRFAENVDLALKVSGVPMTIIGFAFTVAMLILPITTRKMDKKNMLIMFTAFPVITNIILAAVGYERIPVGTGSAVGITILHFIMQVSPIYLIVPIMLGEIADYQQATTGKRLDGHIQNLLFTVPALASQLMMIGISFIQEDVIGFKLKDYQNLPSLNAAQSAIACQWFDVAAIISAISGVLMIIVLLFYPLSRKKHAEIVKQLKAESVITNVGVVTESGEIIKADTIEEAEEIEKEMELQKELELEKEHEIENERAILKEQEVSVNANEQASDVVKVDYVQSQIEKSTEDEVKDRVDIECEEVGSTDSTTIKEQKE